MLNAMSNIEREGTSETPEVRLWRAVVNEAIRGAIWRKKVVRDENGKPVGHKWGRDTQAVAWLRSNNERHFNSFVSLASFTGHNVNTVRAFIDMTPERHTQLRAKHKQPNTIG